MSAPAQDDLDRVLRRSYETDGVYSPATICRKTRDGGGDYVDELLADKLDTVRRHLQPGLLVDLCCATGDHLLNFADAVEEGIGIDFSSAYIDRARRNAVDRSVRNIRFAVGNAKMLPLRDASVGTLYSLSALYTIPNVGEAFAEIGRVLVPGGSAVLDLGNCRSLNSFCVRHFYRELPPTFPITIPNMLALSRASGLYIVEHRVYQLLPLWAGRPWWLMPLLHPWWKRVMKRRKNGRMLDERISSLRICRPFAFRHLLVVRRFVVRERQPECAFR